MKIDVLDKGFVELQDKMGDDMAIVSAARTSYLGESKGAEADKKLLFYLMKHHHDGPLEFVQFRFRIKAPIFVARQWMRHRTGSFNEWSRRYTEDNVEFYYPEVWRTQDLKNKQSSTPLQFPEWTGEEDETLEYLYEESLERSLEVYRKLLDEGIGREMARMVLPVSLYTQFVWSVNLRNLLHFLNLRMDSHAQWETQQYANAIHEILHEVVPWSMEAWQEFSATYETE